MNRDLKQLRIEKGYTLRGLEKRTGISSTYLNEIELGYKVNPSMEIICDLSRGLEESIETIINSIKNTREY